MKTTRDDPEADHDGPATDDRYRNPAFQGEWITPHERCVRPFWPLRYRPKNPRMELGHRVRGWWDRHRWERGEGVTPMYGAPRR